MDHAMELGRQDHHHQCTQYAANNCRRELAVISTHLRAHDHHLLVEPSSTRLARPSPSASHLLLTKPQHMMDSKCRSRTTSSPPSTRSRRPRTNPCDGPVAYARRNLRDTSASRQKMRTPRRSIECVTCVSERDGSPCNRNRVLMKHVGPLTAPQRRPSATFREVPPSSPLPAPMDGACRTALSLTTSSRLQPLRVLPTTQPDSPSGAARSPTGRACEGVDDSATVQRRGRRTCRMTPSLTPAEWRGEGERSARWSQEGENDALSLSAGVEGRAKRKRTMVAGGAG
jgi:hypothetical protein